MSSKECKDGKVKKSSASKPIMEKKRRARINASLNELKQLIVEATKKDNSCHSKLEKADILEMTVGYLRSLKNQQTPTAPSGSSVHFRAGFNECTNEVLRYLSSTNAVDVHIKSMILSHLSSSIKPMNLPVSPYFRPSPTRFNPHGFQLFPSHVVNGKVAAILVPVEPGQPLIPHVQETLSVPHTTTREQLWRPW